MPARPVIVIRLAQIVGWALIVLGAFVAVRTIAGFQGGGPLSPFSGAPSNLDFYVFAAAPTLLFLSAGLICLIAGYILDTLHGIRSDAYDSRRDP